MSPRPTLRFADPATAEAYPLPVPGTAPWQDQGGSWRLVVPLGSLGAGALLLPSLTSAPSAIPARPAAVAMHQWTLHSGATSWSLQAVPAGASPPAAAVAAGGGLAARRLASAVSTHIDCFHLHRPLSDAHLHLTVQGVRPPERYLACVSLRALTVAEPPLPDRAVALAEAPPPRSQMTAPDAIAHRICSPTCVSMVLGLWQRPHDWLAVVEECHDPASGLYGVWPLALAAAARRGSLGAVEAFSSWSDPLAVLARGIPLVTSIRFSAGELPGAPLDETGGHLVVVHGVTPDTVSVCDPAAPDGQVLRRYPAEQFSRAWLRHRGAAYILPP